MKWLPIEKFSQLVFLEICADYADFACVARRTVSDFVFFRNIVEVNPVFAVCHHTLCAKDIAIFTTVKCCENASDVGLCVILCSFKSPSCEHFVCMMVMTTGTMFSMFVVMVVAAGAMFTVFVVMIVTAGACFTVFVVMVVTAGTMFAMFVVVVVAAGTMFAMFVVVVMAAGTMFAVFVMMVVAAGTMFSVFVVMVVTA